MNRISTEELLGRIIAWIQGIQAGDTKIEEDTQILALSLVDSMNLLMLVSKVFFSSLLSSVSVLP